MSNPFRADVATLLTGSLRHEITATAVTRAGARYPLDLDVEGGGLTVTLAEDWAPYAQASITTATPDAALLDALDPRLNVRLELEAGYTYPDNITETFTLADIGLRSRDVQRPANTTGLEAASDEARAQDRAILWNSNVPRSGINEAAAWLLSYSVTPEAPVLVSAYGAGAFAAELADLDVDLGADMWGVLDEIAARTDTRIWCDELRVWRIAPRPSLAGVPVHELTVGEAGTIITSDAGIDREDWANAVLVRHRWTPPGGTPQEIRGIAQVTSGAMATSAVGFRVAVEESGAPISQAAANKKAATRLKNLVSRGRSLKISAIAAYWLRPGDTVRITLPTGAPELHLIRSITFDPLAGSMHITTRQPSNVTISSGE